MVSFFTIQNQDVTSFALDSNSEAVRLSGVDTRNGNACICIICGVLVGIGALFFVATYTTVQPGYGDQYNNEAIAGCVMGGTSMVGGLASIGGTIIGVFIIALLQEGILALGFRKGISLSSQVLLLSSQYSVTYLQDAERTNFSSSILRDQLYE